jgi:methylated-DNA-[protein]-cysteine S-methyltransferase
MLSPQQKTVSARRRPAAGALRVATFETSLGWMAVALRDGRVVRAAFGDRTPRGAVSRLGMPDELEVVDQLTPAEEGLVARLKAFADGTPDDLRDIPIDTGHLTKFALRVVQQCRRIPVGQTLSYAELAARAGSPNAARAVGNVMKSNRFPLLVPCHRVVGAGRSIGGYSAASGLEMKRRLLAREGVYLD